MTESVTSPRSPWGWGLDPLTQGLILIWKLQSQTRTTANQLDQQGKSPGEREIQRERDKERGGLGGPGREGGAGKIKNSHQKVPVKVQNMMKTRSTTIT